MGLKGPWEFENPSCAGVGVDLFYRNDADLYGKESLSILELNQIKSICMSCPCLSECAEWGVSRERWGIWGGMTPKERELIRRRRRRNLTGHENINLLP